MSKCRRYFYILHPTSYSVHKNISEGSPHLYLIAINVYLAISKSDSASASIANSSSALLATKCFEL